jgi:hypothetical protein
MNPFMSRGIRTIILIVAIYLVLGVIVAATA